MVVFFLSFATQNSQRFGRSEMEVLHFECMKINFENQKRSVLPKIHEIDYFSCDIHIMLYVRFKCFVPIDYEKN